MICEKCKKKPVVRGIKQIKCLHCLRSVTVNSAYISLCNKCSDETHKCQQCGDNIPLEPAKISNGGYTNRVIYIAKHSETEEAMVIFLDNSGNSWAVPLSYWEKNKMGLDNDISIFNKDNVFKTNILIGDKYTHYKNGDLYKVLILTHHLFTQRELIVYQAEYGDKVIWTRPLSMWEDKIPQDKITSFNQNVRFKLFTQKSNMKQCITSEQLKELTPKQFRTLCVLIGDELCYDSSDEKILKHFQKEHLTMYISILEKTNIGKMIEILSYDDTLESVYITLANIMKYSGDIFCDALWKELKSKLQ